MAAIGHVWTAALTAACLGSGLACLVMAVGRVGSVMMQLTHGVMGIAMAAMLSPWGDPVPAWAGATTFGVAGARFASMALGRNPRRSEAQNNPPAFGATTAVFGLLDGRSAPPRSRRATFYRSRSCGAAPRTGGSHLVEQAQTGKAAVQRLADRVSAVFVPAVLLLAAGAFGFWLGVGTDVGPAFLAAIAVLVVACPCALGLATPTALLVGAGRGAQLSILIKGPEVLESTRDVDTVVLDRTGTVTTGEMSVVTLVPAAGEDVADVLAVAGALESASAHPIARAIAQYAGRAPAVTGFGALDGLGVRGTVEGRDALVGRPLLLTRAGITLPDDLAAAFDDVGRRGGTGVVVAWSGRARAVVELADTVRPSSAAAVAALRELGLHPILVTGDGPGAACTVAERVGIDEVVVEALPEDKVELVRRLQREGRVVAVVGDGVNDAPALAQADLGIAMGSGTDAAIHASDLTLVRADLDAAVDAIRLARRTLGVIKTNLFWAFAYDVLALPLAITGLLNPMIAGGAMALSSLFVVTNSLRLRRFRPRMSACSKALPASRKGAPAP